MKNRVDYLKLGLVILVFGFVLFFISYLFYQNLTKDTSKSITATVKYKADDYIIVEDVNNIEYKLNVIDDIDEYDVLSIVIDDIDDNVSPITANVKSIDIVSKTINFTIEDNKEDNTNENITDDIDDTNQNNNTTSTEETIPNTTTYSDEEVVSYVRNIDNNLDNYNNDSSLASSIKSGFVTVIDFLFYDGTIGNKTFKELSSAAKLQVLSIALAIDSKIEEYFPNYKEEISTTSSRIYTNIKEKIMEVYLDITVSVCQDNSELCDSAKEGLSNLKSSFSLTWNFIKDIAVDNIDKLKDWYEVWRES